MPTTRVDVLQKGSQSLTQLALESSFVCCFLGLRLVGSESVASPNTITSTLPSSTTSQMQGTPSRLLHACLASRGHTPRRASSELNLSRIAVTNANDDQKRISDEQSQIGVLSTTVTAHQFALRHREGCKSHKEYGPQITQSVQSAGPFYH